MLAKKLLDQINVKAVVETDDTVHTFDDVMLETLDQFEAHFGAIDEMANPAMVTDADVQALDKAIKQGEDKSVLQSMLVSLFKKFEPTLLAVHKKLNKMVPRDVLKDRKNKVLSGIKPFDSVFDKAVLRGKGFQNVNDLVRGAILLDDPAEVEGFMKDFLRKNKSMIVGYESKDKGDDAKYGYFGSHHVDLNIDGIIVELQIMSRKLWSYKTAAHDIYNKYRSSKQDLSKFDQHMSKKLFAMGNAPKKGKKNRKREEFEATDVLGAELVDEAVNPNEYDLSPDAQAFVDKVWKDVKGFKGNVKTFGVDMAVRIAIALDMLSKGEIQTADFFVAMDNLYKKAKIEQ